ncbi:DNA helicase [Fusarium sporotrichioides]|uniref:DNA helicase n=1 Tax=Fusarium sporotrichioides TaxID=5514 RepID=A0A395SHL6_FUSSP|nr:DNA helicase [Fusarium sporotrichioides]
MLLASDRYEQDVGHDDSQEAPAWWGVLQHHGSVASSIVDIESSTKEMDLGNKDVCLQSLPLSPHGTHIGSMSVLVECFHHKSVHPFRVGASENFLQPTEFMLLRSVVFILYLLHTSLKLTPEPLLLYQIQSHFYRQAKYYGSGFGKTTTATAVVREIHATMGKVLASGPANIGVNNLCARIYAVSYCATGQYNDDKQRDSLQHHLLILRGFKLDIEHATLELLFSATYWLLIYLGFSTIPALHDDDSKALQTLRDDLAK